MQKQSKQSNNHPNAPKSKNPRLHLPPLKFPWAWGATAEVMEYDDLISECSLRSKYKGRAFRHSQLSRHRGLASANFDSLSSDGGPGPLRSVEGWVVLVTGLREEAQEDDLHDVFRDYGQVKSLHLNLDHRTGFIKGYALIEYENVDEALAAITALDGAELLTQPIHVDWAFSNGSFNRRNIRRSPRSHRSRSPPRRRY